MDETRLIELLEARLENRLTAAEAAELFAELRTSPDARQRFWDYFEQHALIADILSETRGRDLALLEEGRPEFEVHRTKSDAGANWSRSRLKQIAFWTTLAAALFFVAGLWINRGHQQPGTQPVVGRDASSVATVQSLSGEVQVTDASGKTMSLTPGAELFEGQVLHVGDEDSQVEVCYADGTKVSLGAGSVLRLVPAESKAAKRVHLETGAVQVRTAAQTVDRSLIVTTDRARITARETQFRVYCEPGASRVEVEEGKAQVATPDGAKSMDLVEGSFVMAGDAPDIMVSQPLPMGYCRLRHTFIKAGDAIAFSSDGAQLLASHFSRGLKVWNVADGSLSASAPGTGEWTNDMAFTTAKDCVIALGRGGSVALWKIGELQANKTRLCDKGPRCGAVSEDGRWLVQGEGNREVTIWEADPATGSLSLRHSLPIKASRVALSGDGSRAAVSKWGGEICIFDVNTGREVLQYKLKRTPTPLALSQDSRFTAAYANGDGLVLFDQQAGNRLTLWSGEGARVNCLQFSKDGLVLLAGLDDGTLRAWATADGKPLLVLATGNRHVGKIVATNDLSLIATVGDSDCVKIWECKLP